MRPEKKYLIDEAVAHIADSDYVFLMNFTGVTVAAASDLRKQLAEKGAQFHIVKNTIFEIAAKSRELPDMSEFLNGPTGVVAGGKSPTEVAKILVDFLKNNDRADVKVGVLDKKLLNKDEIEALSKLPNLDGIRSMLLSTILLAAPQGLLNVIKAKSEKEEAPQV